MQTAKPDRTDPSTFPDMADLLANDNYPDPLLFRDGTPVKSLDEWQNERKPELKALFQHYMYGYAPPAPRIRATVRSTDDSALGGAATLKQVSIHFGPEGAPPIELLLVVPNNVRGGRLPGVFLGLNFGGNHTVLTDATVRLPTGATAADRGKSTAEWAIAETIARGYAVATFFSADVAPDRPDFDGGIFPFFDAANGERPRNAWGIIAAWAWGLQRAVDYLLTESLVDGGRIILYGFSRNGKAALLAAAFDDRVSAVVAHQAGCGGSGPSRCETGDAETVSRITTSFPCWFCSNFAAFGGNEERLPFDQNCLVALCAPRPVLFSAGSRDRWSNPDGQRKVQIGASAVYGAHGIDVKIPELAADPVLDSLIGAHLTYCLRETAHTVDKSYWSFFADFGDRLLP